MGHMVQKYHGGYISLDNAYCRLLEYILSWIWCCECDILLRNGDVIFCNVKSGSTIGEKEEVRGTDNMLKLDIVHQTGQLGYSTVL